MNLPNSPHLEIVDLVHVCFSSPSIAWAMFVQFIFIGSIKGMHIYNSFLLHKKHQWRCDSADKDWTIGILWMTNSAYLNRMWNADRTTKRMVFVLIQIQILSKGSYKNQLIVFLFWHVRGVFGNPKNLYTCIYIMMCVCFGEVISRSIGIRSNMLTQRCIS